MPEPVRRISAGSVPIGGGSPLVLIAGPCGIESPSPAMMLAERIGAITSRLNVPFIFKASYDKANRTSLRSFRGPGLEQGLETLASIRNQFRVPVLTDVHDSDQALAAGKVVDVIQI